MAEWFEKREAEILDELETGMKGLSQTEAEKRLEKYGENRLREQGHLPWWQVFLAQFKDLLVVILIGAAAVSMMTKDARSAMVIFTVLLLNACLGTIQHERAEKTLDSLRRLSSPEARVLRGKGAFCSINPGGFRGYSSAGSRGYGGGGRAAIGGKSPGS